MQDKNFQAGKVRNTYIGLCNPVWLSGSAVENLFSRLKNTAKGKLSVISYNTSRAAHLMKHIMTPHHNSQGYRDALLQIEQVILEKKKYEHTVTNI